MSSTYMQDVEKRLIKRNLTLPETIAPAANYVPFKFAANTLYISGQIPIAHNGQCITGICGSTISTDEAIRAAEICALYILAQARSALGDLDRLKGVTKLVGFVAATPDFAEHPLVVNGASNLLVDILGERGQHARSAIGVSSLPFGIPVEVEAILHVKC